MSAIVAASIVMLPPGAVLPGSTPTLVPTAPEPTSAPTPRFSVKMNVEHAVMNGCGVFLSPKPSTSFPASRSRCARPVKSLSLETMQKPSRSVWCSRSIASMMIAPVLAMLQDAIMDANR
jgi:hypothetical protein